jgi:predicted DNA-binding transcriptional regulator YafY
MPVNKNQFLRQEILAGILSRNQLTRKDLKDVLNEKLAMHDLGPVHEKTVYNDLKELERQGAVIHFPSMGDNRYYFEERFNPGGNQLTVEELDTLENALQILKGLSVFNLSKDVADVLLRLKATRGNIDVNSPSFIAFEDHTLSEGTEWMDDLVEAIRGKIPLKIDYQPFYKETSTFAFHPWFLKEYRNRWFVFGLRQDHDRLVVLALDRIHRLKPASNVSWHENDRFDPYLFFESMIGVSLPTEAKPEKITLRIFRRSAMHVETKKIHHSQRLLAKNDDGSIDVELTVVVNYELISTLLGFGAAVKVLGPEGVVNAFREIISESLALYQVN